MKYLLTRSASRYISRRRHTAVQETHISFIINDRSWVFTAVRSYRGTCQGLYLSKWIMVSKANGATYWPLTRSTTAFSLMRQVDQDFRNRPKLTWSHIVRGCTFPQSAYFCIWGGWLQKNPKHTLHAYLLMLLNGWSDAWAIFRIGNIAGW
jgi:hypothetical protein